MLVHLSTSPHPSFSLLPLQHPKKSPLLHSLFFFLFSTTLFASFSLSHTPLLPPSAFSPVIIITLSIFHQLLLLCFHPLLLLFLSLFLYMGNTRKPEKVEYFHPPIRFPLSSLR